MPVDGFLKQRGIVRDAIREDLIFFAIPAFLVFFVGMVVSALDGLDGLMSTISSLIKQQWSYSDFSVPNFIGIAFIILGYVISIISLFTIRSNYASSLVIRENHQLITHGIYRFVRHPIYFGVLTVAFGFPLYASSLFGILIMALLLPIFLIRIRIEERMLLAEFGEIYQNYQATTRKLIPFLF